jgi:hypothetical protein
MRFPLLSNLLRWPVLLACPVAFLAPLLLAGTLAGESSRSFFIGGQPADHLSLTEAGETTGRLSQMVLQVSALWAAATGMVVSAAMTTLQRAPLSWLLPNLGRSVRRDLLIAALAVLISVVVWCSRFAPVATVVLAALLSVWWFAIFSAWGHVSLAVSESVSLALVPLAVLTLLVAFPGGYASAASMLGWPIASMLALGGVWLVRSATTRASHRRLLLWNPAFGQLDAPTPGADIAFSKRRTGSHGAWWYFRLLAEEERGRPWNRRLRLHPIVLTHVFLAAFYAAAIQLGGVGPFLFLLSGTQRWLSIGRDLPYPVARHERAKVQFLEHTLSAVVLFGVGSLLLWGMNSLQVAPLWPDDAPTGMAAYSLPLSVGATFAVFPIVQMVRAFAPVISGTDEMVRGYPRQLLLAFLALVVAGIASKIVARETWQLTDGMLPSALMLVFGIALLLHAAQYPALRLIFARRDLVPRRVSPL